MRRCQRTWKRTRAALPCASSRSQWQANKHRLPAPQYAPGQRVWLRAWDLPLKGVPPELSPCFIGPFEIKTIINPCADFPHPSVYIRPSTSPRSSPSPPACCLSQLRPQSTHLEVRRCGRGHKYLVDWEGYGPEERSWVPRSRILDASLIRDFHRDHPSVVGRPPRGVCRTVPLASPQLVTYPVTQ